MIQIPPLTHLEAFVCFFFFLYLYCMHRLFFWFFMPPIFAFELSLLRFGVRIWLIGTLVSYYSFLFNGPWPFLGGIWCYWCHWCMLCHASLCGFRMWVVQFSTSVGYCYWFCVLVHWSRSRPYGHCPAVTYLHTNPPQWQFLIVYWIVPSHDSSALGSASSLSLAAFTCLAKCLLVHDDCL